MLPLFAIHLAKMIKKVVIGSYVHMYGTYIGGKRSVVDYFEGSGDNIIV